MKFTYVTLFENLISPYFEDSILKKAIEKNLLSIDFYNPRDYTKNKHNKVDDYQAGGGAGLLLNAQPLFDTLKDIKSKNPNAYFIFPAPAGKPFVQVDAKRLAKKEHIVFVNGRYEGIDERVVETYADEIFSIGDYVLTGGELASTVMSDAISRNISGVLGNEDSLEEESFENKLLEAPSFTKPTIFENKSIPSEFLKGNHGKISNLKNEMAKLKTKYFRPDLFSRSDARR
ncbi:tRNA (guanosine(37)-N1)-methyltransferase TrmD [Sulfurospirillum arcachonense]|uniref:tRNA (guanosine(37)-N1)-methyltransferase TrmD n=1 Tax=Sulfurospirillum arcachonense TaxID=57666 RepID=UPI00046AE793|nr:tRNA (guanosine(37)-N1)-methyltransferase TrmD [Sulfurospirillum arcachonense]